MPPDEYRCPTHGVALEVKPTRYGPRASCPEFGCTVVHWINGSTSTPADAETRAARMAAHAAFDKLWLEGDFSRGEAYRQLAMCMRIGKHDCHIGRFNKDQCAKVLEFVEQMTG